MIKSAAEVPGFAEKIIQWQQQHGRHDLPWQSTRDAYAVWVSEIMLQQTQVSTVIPYYQRFMQRFPDIASLAQAEQESVLQYWSGLGYYSRARNLHAAAQQIMSQQGGAFPQSLDQAVSLPGIGRSTAAAILCFAFGQPHAILDGNVKRVLTRCYGIAGWPGKPSIEKQLWQLAASVLPKRDNESYIQGLMDLGASVCTRSKPACSRCPLQHDCVAKREQRVAFLPSAKPRKLLPEKNTVMLLLWNGSEILLQKRPPIGIWGGMWSLPELNSQNNLFQQIQAQLGLQAEMVKQLPLLRHSFTHFRLHITPLLMRVTKRSLHLQQDSLAWRSIDDALDGPIPSPIRKLIMEIAA